MNGKPVPAAMSPSPNPDDLVIFGLDEAGRAHASRFAGENAELIGRAAAAMAMRVIRITGGEHEPLLKRLPHGKLFGSGKAFVPYVKAGTHDEIIALAKQLGQYQDEEPARVPLPAEPIKRKVAMPHLPEDWSQIAVGSIVLASEGHKKIDGWFEAKVLEQNGKDLFTVAWRDWPDESPFARLREHLGLLNPKLVAE